MHFLHFDASDYGRQSFLIKRNPAIKDAADREAIIRVLAESQIDIVAADPAPATLFDMQGGGYLREGYAADLVLVDPNKPHTVARGEVLSLCGWSPFEGETFRSSIVSTFVNGQRVWDGAHLDGSVRGERLTFDR